jgi:hypothetical protein
LAEPALDLGHAHPFAFGDDGFKSSLLLRLDDLRAVIHEFQRHPGDDTFAA